MPAGDSPTPRSASTAGMPSSCRRAGRGTRPTGMSSPVCTIEPSSNDATIGPSRSGRTRARNTSSTAAFMMRSSTWPSRPSSSVSISILPDVDAASASRSETRGTTSRSPLRERAPGRVGDERLVVRDRQARRHTRALVDVRRAARELADLGDDLGHEVGHGDLQARRPSSGRASWSMIAISSSVSSG